MTGDPMLDALLVGFGGGFTIGLWVGFKLWRQTYVAAPTLRLYRERNRNG